MTGATPARDPASIDAGRILVVAPHPDDEALGCGGLVAALAPLGRRFHVVFVTDGGASHPNSVLWPRPRLASLREAEAGEALVRLGIGTAPRTFLRLPDAAMPAPGTAECDAAVATVSRIVEDFGPDLVLLPWRRDPHCDHRDSWSLARSAMRRAGSSAASLEYAVWLDEIGAPDDHPRPGEMERIAFDVSAVAEAKRSAVAAHLSQTNDLVGDDPGAFRLTEDTVARLTGPVESYWRALS